MVKLENLKTDTIPKNKLIQNNDIVEKCKTEDKILMMVKNGYVEIK